MSSQRRTVTLLRWVMFLALAYLIWASRSGHAPVQIVLLAIVAASNVALARIPLRTWEHPALLPAVALSDIGVLTASMAWGQGFVREFFFAYFVLLAVVAMASTLRWAAVGTTLVVAAYGVLMGLQNGQALLQSPELIGRLGFLLAVGIGYGGLTEAGKVRLREGAMREELVGWVGKLSRAFAEEFDAHDLIRQLLLDVQQLYPGTIRASVVQIVGGRMLVIGSSDDGEVREQELDLERYPELVEVIERQEPVVIDDMLSSTLMANVQEQVRSLPFRGLLLCPVTIDDPSIGSVVLRVGRDAGAFSPASVDATRDVARAIGVIFRQAKLRDAYERSQRMEMVSQVTRGVAHSFESILSTVLLSAEVLRRQTLRHAAASACAEPPCDADSQARFESIELAVREGMTIVDRLAAWSRTGREEGSSADDWEIVDAVGLMQEAWTYARPQWQRRRATRDLELDLQIGSTAPVRGNPAELREVLLNLMVNAIDAMPKGGVLTLALREESGRVGFTVRDTGIGMAEEQLERAFEPLFSTKGNGGTGLGLSIARSVATRHDGEIEAHSTPGVGTEMTLWMPAVTDQTALGRRRPQVGRRVLLVERNELVRDVIGRFLESAGLDVDPVTCLDEAEVMIENRGRYSMVLADALTVAPDLAAFLRSDHPEIDSLTLYSNGSLHEELQALQNCHGFAYFDRSQGLAALSDLLEGAERRVTAA